MCWVLFICKGSTSVIEIKYKPVRITQRKEHLVIWKSHCAKNHISQVLEYHRKLKKTKYISSFHQLLSWKKAVFPITEKFKTRISQQPVNIIFPSTFCLKKDPISHSRKHQNKNFSVVSEYQLSINFLTQKRPCFPFPKKLKQELFNNQ